MFGHEMQSFTYWKFPFRFPQSLDTAEVGVRLIEFLAEDPVRHCVCELLQRYCLGRDEWIAIKLTD